MGRIIIQHILDDELGTVWGFITEPMNFPTYVYGYFDGKIISQNRTGLGASYEWYGKLGPFKLKSIEEIIEWQERKRVAYRGTLFGIKFNSSMDVIDLGRQTLLTIAIEYKVPLYCGGVVIDILLLRWFIKNYLRKSFDNLKRNM